MTPLKAYRQERGFSQRELARKAGIAYRTVQFLEAGGSGFRWSTLTKLARALKLSQPQALISEGQARSALTAADTARRMREEGKDSWKLELFEFVDAFRRTPHLSLLARAPDPDTDRRSLALVACVVESLCAQYRLAAPWWCAGAPSLPEPWFVSGMESLKATALVESPAIFRSRNIFVLGNFLSRA